MKNESLESLARKLAESIPEGLKTLGDDLERNFHSILKSGMQKLDLVTREEFEVQQAVLERTREKLERLQKKLEEFEQQ